MNNYRIIVVIPTYNEASNLAAITDALFGLNISGLSVLVVDDNSPDGTGQIADELVERHPGKFFVIHRQGKAGLGTAYLAGFRHARDLGADYVIQMDADFSHSPRFIPQMLTLMEDWDVVVGSRYVPGGKVDERWSYGRWLLSWWANSVWVRFWLRTKTHDATAGFKCWRAAALGQLALENVHSDGYVFQVEMCYAAEKCGLRILEIPIYFEDRRIGKSKMSIPIKIEAAIRVIELALKRKHC